MRQLASSHPALIRFGYPELIRSRGRAACLVATAMLLVVSLAGDPQSDWWLPTLVSIALLAGAGVVAMLHVASLEVDLRDRTYRFQPGPLRLYRQISGSTDEFRRLQTVCGPGGGVVQIVGERGTWTVCRGEDPLGVAQTARQVAEVLGTPTGPADTRQTEGQRLARRLTRLIGWGATACLATALVAPIAGVVVPEMLADPPGARAARAQARESYRQGIARYWFRDYRGAAAVLREAARTGDDAANALNMLAYAYAEQGRLDEALATARQALREAPLDPNIIDTVGEMHERRREFKRAAVFYERALRRMRPEASTQTHAKLGRTLIALGRRQEARAQLRQALAYGVFDQWTGMADRLARQLGGRGAQVAPQRPVPRPGSAWATTERLDTTRSRTSPGIGPTESGIVPMW